MDARERHLAVLHGEEPDRTNITAAAGLRLPPYGGWLRRLVERGMCETHIVPVHKPFFLFTRFANPNLVDTTYHQTYFNEDGLNKIRHTFETPVGTLYSTVARNPFDNVAGATPETHFVKGPDDWHIINYIMEGMMNIMKPNYNEILLDQEDLGGKGFTIGVVERTPFQKAWIELADIGRTVMDFKRRPDEFLRYIELQKQYHLKAAEIAAGAPTPHILLIDNITNIISPKLYREYSMPIYKLYADAIKGGDNKLAVHLDGLIKHIAHDIEDSAFDIVDSFTVPPTGNVSISEAKEQMPSKQLFINLPPHLAQASVDELRKAYAEIIDEWGSKTLTIEHVEDLPVGAEEKHLAAAMDVCGYPD